MNHCLRRMGCAGPWMVAFAATLAAAHAGSPFERLPPPESPQSSFFLSPTPILPAQPAQPAAFDNPALRPSPAESWTPPPLTRPRARVARQGSFQTLSLTATWLPAPDSDDLQTTDFEAYATFGLPFPTTDAPLLVSPVFGSHLHDGPTGVEMPGHLYDAYLELRHLRRLSPRLLLNLMVAPGFYSDFEGEATDGFRMPAQALGVYDLSETSKLVFGLLYLDRSNVNWLPAGGWIWTPTDDFRLDLVFPRPKISWLLAADCDRETWGYFGGEFGGDTWTYVRSDGVQDVVTTSDWRILAGIEQKPIREVIAARCEVGFAFNRKLQFDSDDDSLELDPTWLVRAGVKY